MDEIKEATMELRTTRVECIKSPTGEHCWHRKSEIDDLTYTTYVGVPICCHCGLSERDIHGPYNPDKKRTVTVRKGLKFGG